MAEKEIFLNKAEEISDNHERKRMEEALWESNELYRSIINASPDDITTTDLEGRILMISPMGLKMFRYDREEEMLGRVLIDFVVPEDRERAAADIALMFQGNIKGSTAYRGIRKDGSIIDFEVNAEFIRDADGQPTKIILIVRDITKRIQMEEALRDSEEKLTDILNNMRDVAWSVSWPDFNILYISPSAETVYGRPVEMFYNNSSLWSECVHPDDKHLIEKAFEQLLKNGTSERESRIFRPDGSILWICDKSRIIFDQNNHPVRLNGITSDISDRKKTEIYKELSRRILQILNEPGDFQDSIQNVLAALKTQTGFGAVGIRLQDGDDFPYFAQKGFSDDFLLTENTLIEHTTNGGLCRDKDGNVRLACTCGLVISGKSDRGNLPFTPGGSFWTNDSFPILDVSPCDDPRFHARNQCMLKGYASMALVPIRNKDRIVGLIHFNDRRKGCFASDTVELMEGIASHIGDAMVRKRTEDTLRISEEALRVLLAEKELLLKEVHHRVKNNLAAIIGLLSLQSGKLDDKPAKAALEELSNRIRSMSLIHEQLYQSKDLSRINFQDYLNTLIAHLRSSYQRSGDIYFSVAATDVKMGLDNAVPCGLLITELVTNAFKYAFPADIPRTGICRCEIAVSMQWDGAAYTLVVADNGVGLPAGMDWTKTKTLGLMLVKMLGQHQLQGQIELDCTCGTTFKLRFAPQDI